MPKATILKQAHISSYEYSLVQNLKAFNEADWKWNPETTLYDRIV